MSVWRYQFLLQSEDTFLQYVYYKIQYTKLFVLSFINSINIISIPHSNSYFVKYFGSIKMWLIVLNHSSWKLNNMDRGIHSILQTCFSLKVEVRNLTQTPFCRSISSRRTLHSSTPLFLVNCLKKYKTISSRPLKYLHHVPVQDIFQNWERYLT